jgi:FAD/FMN-containing dehydrogenase
VPSGTRTLARIGNNQLNYQVGKGRISPDHGSCRRRILSVLSSASSHHERDGIQRGSQELRGPTLHDLTHFRSILSRPDRSIITVLTDEASQRQLSSDSRAEELVRYNQDWTGEYRGSSSLVLRPTNTSEVSSILRYCHENFIGVVPQGGNTGLCGGATPLHDEVIISLEGMNTIYGIDGQSGILTCDAGAILENLHSFANERGYLFPLDIGAKGSCQIGGNVSTNAGGQYFFRFGGLHGTVMGLEVVLPDGRVMHLNMENVDDYGTIQQSKRIASHRKDNTGYDLKHLFIGAEGTIGMITKVSIACPALPTSKNATLLVCDSYCNVLKVLKTAKEEVRAC